MSDQPKQLLTDDSIYLSDSPEIRSPIDENWQARRDLAAILRRLNTALLTADVPTRQLRALSALLSDEIAKVENNERLYGRQAHKEHNYRQHRIWHDFFYEMSPTMGISNPASLPMHIWHENGRVYAEVTPDWTFEGLPGYLHGGVIAALFDQVLGLAQLLTGKDGLTAYLKTSYHQPTPLNRKLRFTAELDRVEGRKKFIVGELWADDLRTASCEGLFITEKDNTAIAGADLPDHGRKN